MNTLDQIIDLASRGYNFHGSERGLDNLPARVGHGHENPFFAGLRHALNGGCDHSRTDLLDIRQHFRRFGITLLTRGDRAFDNLFEVWKYRRRKCVQVHREFAAQHFVKNDARGIDIDGVVETAGCHFRSDVAGGSGCQRR